jgi:hypothetical protein
MEKEEKLDEPDKEEKSDEKESISTFKELVIKF